MSAKSRGMAEGEGFEPPRLITWLFSRQLPSTTRPSLHYWRSRFASPVPPVIQNRRLPHVRACTDEVRRVCRCFHRTADNSPKLRPCIALLPIPSRSTCAPDAEIHRAPAGNVSFHDALESRPYCCSC